jgi:glycosyltransferase involved in cell wall biosynthesis
VYEVRGFPEVALGSWAGSRVGYEKSLWRRQVEAHCWREADRVVTLAGVMKRHIAASGVDPDHIEVMPNAVDPERFRPIDPDPALRARLGIEPGDFVVGYVSTLVGYEGLPFLVDAVSRLAGRGWRVRALIVGDGWERTHLGQLAERLGIGDRVIFPGYVPHSEVLDYYALMDVFVVPRRDEETCRLVTPLKPYEAMAAGKVVVAAATTALKEMVEEEVTGLTFRPEDAEDLARVVERLAADPELRERLGRQAREWVSTQRTWRQNAARYVRLYEELGAL